MIYFSVSFFLLLSSSLWAFFLLYLCISKFYCFSRKRFYYSPPSYPFFGCLISFYKNRRRLLAWYTDLLSDSPTQTIVVHRLGSRRTVVTANPANVEHMLKTNFINYPKGKPFTDILGDLLGCGIFNVDGDLWSSQRKLASHAFSAKSLREFVVKTLEDEVHLRLIPLLSNAARTNAVIDLQDVLGRLAFDTVCKVCDLACMLHLLFILYYIQLITNGLMQPGTGHFSTQNFNRRIPSFNFAFRLEDNPIF